jgi:predicted alpha/beta superfamily hydrolase
MIIVGIANTNRMRDLTPTHIRNTRTISDTSIFRDTGGGSAFFSFLEKELFPYVEQHYPANAYRVLAGHSLGGLMVADALLSRPGLCQGWISIDPSIWYDDAYLLRRMEIQQYEEIRKPTSFFMAMANNLPKGMDTVSMQRDSSATTEDNRAIQSFATRLKKHARTNLSWSWKFYPEDDHGSVTSIALYDGLRYVFRDYRLPAFRDLLAPAADPVRMLEEWSARNTAQWGFPVHAPEAFVNGLGYTMLYRENAHAAKVFEYNSRCYPESPHVYMALADYYRSLKMDERARAMDERAKALRAGSEY